MNFVAPKTFSGPAGMVNPPINLEWVETFTKGSSSANGDKQYYDAVVFCMSNGITKHAWLFQNQKARDIEFTRICAEVAKAQSK